MKLIVGLGNPGKEYENTFHNLGFMALDCVVDYFGVNFNKEKSKALIAEERINGEKVIFAKPQTYMNLSGESVRELLDFYKISPSDLVVIYDDFDLPIGAVRFREEGSAGTHNGMRNIIKEIKTEKFKRVRVGFHPKENSPIPLLDLVLSKIKGESEETLSLSLNVVKNALIDYLKGKEFNVVMQKYNKKAE
ncbi:MAG: aminoacyl-tRNA hydrolase [Clostridia bacterium]|nr:aminoacyl-tRNA hydrolase [Clostridia bacterium]